MRKEDAKRLRKNLVKDKIVGTRMWAMTAPNVHNVVKELIIDEYDNLGHHNKTSIKLLDVGAGLGLLSCELATMGFDVSACDINPSSFKCNGVRCDYADLNEGLPYESVSFDCLTCIELIEHLENPWFSIRELHRVLKQHGIMILSTPNMSNIFYKFLFMIKDVLPWFEEENYKTGHLTPVFRWNLQRMIHGRFVIEDERYNCCLIPIVRRRMRTRSPLLGDVAIFKLRKV